MSGISVVLFIMCIISIVVNILLLINRSSAKADKDLTLFLAQNLSGRLSLAKSFPVSAASGSSANEIASSFQYFIGKLREVFKSVFSLGFNLSTTSDSMKESSGKLRDMSDKTSFQAEQVTASMNEMSATINDIARNALTAADSSKATKKNADAAEKDINENRRSIEHVSGNVSSWADTNRTLSEATSKIDEIILAINDIADQTNLLALNAAIEAARAGEHGRGFAIVADEVRKLADKTGKATEEIAVMVKDVKTKADDSLSTMDRTLKGVDESIVRSKEAEESLKKIVADVNRMTDMIQQIATAAEEQSTVANDVLANMEKVSGYAAETRELATNISASGDSLSALSINLYSRLCSIKIDTLDENMEMVLKTYSARLISLLAEAIKAGRINTGALFDEHYIKTGDDGKFSTKFTVFFQSEVLSTLRQCARAEKNILYAVAMDRNGYMPTHIMPERAGVRMQDPISLNGARCDRIIGQAFRRPVAAGGELVVDIAAPIIVEGRQWGCLRIGYLPEMT